MDKPAEGEAKNIEVNSERRNFMTVAAAAGVAGAAVGRAAGAQAAQPAPAPEVKEPEKPASLKPDAELDGRFPVMYEASVPEAMRLATQYMAALNRRDLDGLSRLFHYPFVTYEGIDTVVVNSREELMSNPPPSLNTTGKGANKIRPNSYDILDDIQLLVYTPVGAGVALRFSRFDANGKRLQAVHGIYGITNNDGKWGIEYMSTIFRPADQVHLKYDADEFAERSIHDTYRDHNLGRKYNGLNRNYTSIDLPNPGKWGGVTIGSYSFNHVGRPGQSTMDSYKVKGVKSRLRVSDGELVGPAPVHPDPNKPLVVNQGDERFRNVSGGKVGKFFQTLEWHDSRVLAADMEKAHAISGNNRFAEDGSLLNRGVYMVVLLYRNGQWTASDNGGAIFGRQMYQDRSNDVLPQGV
jgi:hypothetical protein